jgi:KUP system potassium uptake protein
MPPDDEADYAVEHTSHTQRLSAGLVVAALGVVFGDLGTSPLYTTKVIAQALGGKLDRGDAIGSLSLIFWALILTVSIKYCLLVMRADNHGEGGILALMSMTRLRWRGRRWPLIACGLFGAALLYGDGVITPAISVMSALEGLDVATDAFKHFSMPLAVVVLVMLFAVQRLGTARVGAAFGPVMLLWFIVIAALGIVGIYENVAVLGAANPAFAVEFIERHRFAGFVVLGAVFLAITGGEALYADMGHFGKGPVRLAWFGLVLPALVLNYAGQTARLLDSNASIENPFFSLAPAWSRLPLVALATLAAIIASQAIISGAFSLTRQAIQLGWLPGLMVRQTSPQEYGQIYVPVVNWTMMALTIALTIAFGSSDRLAGAYGTAVSTTMLATTILLYRVMRVRWLWRLSLALPVFLFFLVVDCAFFAANLLKIREGGWIPLMLAGMLFIVMTTWRDGVDSLRRSKLRHATSLREFLRELDHCERTRTPNAAVFLARVSQRVPPLIAQHVQQIGAVPRTLIALAVRFIDRPHVQADQRVGLRRLGPSFWQLTIHYGFMDFPNVAATLNRAGKSLGGLELDDAVYFAERDDVVGKASTPLWRRWRRGLFASMFRNSVHPVDRFTLPCKSLVEIGRRIEI